MIRFVAAHIMLFMALCASAVVYTPQTVPNVHAADRTKFVADPDNALSAQTEARLNLMLSQMRKNLTVEPMVVVVNEATDELTPEDFATELFGEWGLGKADLDNGLLIYVDLSSHAVVIRPGYGLEGALPDITLGRIIREKFIPAAQTGDIDQAVLSTASTINSIISDPNLAEEYRSKEADADESGVDDDDIDAFKFYLSVMALAAVVMLILLIYKMVSLRGKSDYDKYRALAPLKAPYLVLGVGGLGIPLVATIPLIIALNRWRNKPHICPNCSTKMNKVDEVHDNDYLNPAQDLEERIGSVDYDVWLCPQCGETDILAYTLPSSTYSECDNCHYRTLRPTGYRIVKQPTSLHKGLAVKEYECLNCHHHRQDKIELPKEHSASIAGAATAASILGRGGSSGGFGGTFGGGFGGGMTGGGGASGRW